MKVRIEIAGVNGQWDVDIPEDHAYIKWACDKRAESGKVGWDAVGVFERAIRDCLSEDMTANIIANAGSHRQGWGYERRNEQGVSE